MNNSFDYRKLNILGVIFLSAASLFLLAKTVGAVKAWQDKGTATDTRAEITVSGKGEVTAVPDTAEFTFSVTENAATVSAAQDQATARSNKALAYLKSQGIKDEDIQTQSYTTNPQYEYQQTVCTKTACPPGKQVLTGYEVSQSVSVKIHDTSKSGTLLAGLGSVGVENISGLSMTLSNQDALDRQAREKAIADAETKAKQLAQDLGVSLVRITSYSENGQSPIMYGMKSQAMDAAVPAVAPAPEIPTGQNTITSNVTIAYEIR